MEDRFSPTRIGRLERMSVLFALGFVVVLVVAGALAGGKAALVALRGVRLPLVAAMLALSAVNYICRALRWLLFSRAMGVAAPAGLNALYYVAGFAMTATPGKIGEALRLWLLRRGHGFRYVDTAGLLIADRLFDAVAMACVLCASVAAMAAFVWVSGVVLVGVAAAMLCCLRPVVLRRVLRVGAWALRGRRRVFAGVQRGARRLACLGRGAVLAPALGLGVVGWLAEGLSLYLLARELGLPIGALGCVFVFAFSMVAGAISILPGGLGATEASMAGLLHLLHAPASGAIEATAVVRVTTLWFAVGLGMVALPVALRITLRRAGATVGLSGLGATPCAVGPAAAVAPSGTPVGDGAGAMSHAGAGARAEAGLA